MTSLRIATVTAGCMMLIGMFSENTDLNSVDLKAEDNGVKTPIVKVPVAEISEENTTNYKEVPFSIPTLEGEEKVIEVNQVEEKFTEPIQKSAVMGQYVWRRGPLGFRRWRVWVPNNAYSSNQTFYAQRYYSRPRARIFRGRSSSCGPFGCYCGALVLNQY